MEKLFYLCMAILVFPVLRLKWIEFFTRIFKPFLTLWNTLKLKTGMAAIGQKKWFSWFKRGEKKTKGARVFAETFHKHFDPDNGLFSEDKTLRKRVYELFIKTVREGTQYKSIYRKMAGAFHPNSAPHSRLLYDELEVLFKYYQANFTHPDDLKK